MEGPTNGIEAWVRSLSHEQVVDELARRDLQTNGIFHVARQRLLKFFERQAMEKEQQRLQNGESQQFDDPPQLPVRNNHQVSNLPQNQNPIIFQNQNNNLESSNSQNQNQILFQNQNNNLESNNNQNQNQIHFQNQISNQNNNNEQNNFQIQNPSLLQQNQVPINFQNVMPNPVFAAPNQQPLPIHDSLANRNQEQAPNLMQSEAFNNGQVREQGRGSNLIQIGEQRAHERNLNQEILELPGSSDDRVRVNDQLIPRGVLLNQQGFVQPIVDPQTGIQNNVVNYPNQNSFLFRDDVRSNVRMPLPSGTPFRTERVDIRPRRELFSPASSLHTPRPAFQPQIQLSHHPEFTRVLTNQNPRFQQGGYYYPQDPRMDFSRSFGSVQSQHGNRNLVQICAMMKKWNLIKFTGHENAEGFLERVREGRAIMPVSDADLIACLPFFLSGIALAWFRDRRSGWNDYSDFEAAFMQRFVKPDYQFALQGEIFARTQGDGEPVADYLTCIHTLMNRLIPPWDIAQQLGFAYRNMQPRLRLAVPLSEVHSFAELELLAVRCEEIYLSAKSFRAPPPPERSMDSDLAFHPLKSSKPRATAQVALVSEWGEEYEYETEDNQETEESEELFAVTTRRGGMRATVPAPPRTSNRGRKPKYQPVPRVPPVIPPSSPTLIEPPRPTPKPPLPRPVVNPVVENRDSNSPETGSQSICWNCDEPGHRFKDCQIPWGIFCFKCGKKDFTKITCPICKSKGKGNHECGQ